MEGANVEYEFEEEFDDELDALISSAAAKQPSNNENSPNSLPEVVRKILSGANHSGAQLSSPQKSISHENHSLSHNHSPHSHHSHSHNHSSLRAASQKSPLVENSGGVSGTPKRVTFHEGEGSSHHTHSHSKSNIHRHAHSPSHGHHAGHGGLRQSTEEMKSVLNQRIEDTDNHLSRDPRIHDPSKVTRTSHTIHVDLNDNSSVLEFVRMDAYIVERIAAEVERNRTKETARLMAEYDDWLLDLNLDSSEAAKILFEDKVKNMDAEIEKMNSDPNFGRGSREFGRTVKVKTYSNEGDEKMIRDIGVDLEDVDGERGLVDFITGGLTIPLLHVLVGLKTGVAPEHRERYHRILSKDAVQASKATALFKERLDVHIGNIREQKLNERIEQYKVSNNADSVDEKTLSQLKEEIEKSLDYFELEKEFREKNTNFWIENLLPDIFRVVPNTSAAQSNTHSHSHSHGHSHGQGHSHHPKHSHNHSHTQGNVHSHNHSLNHSHTQSNVHSHIQSHGHTHERSHKHAHDHAHDRPHQDSRKETINKNDDLEPHHNDDDAGIVSEEIEEDNELDDLFAEYKSSILDRHSLNGNDGESKDRIQQILEISKRANASVASFDLASSSGLFNDADVVQSSVSIDADVHCEHKEIVTLVEFARNAEVEELAILLNDQSRIPEPQSTEVNDDCTPSEDIDIPFDNLSSAGSEDLADLTMFLEELSKVEDASFMVLASEDHNISDSVQQVSNSVESGVQSPSLDATLSEGIASESGSLPESDLAELMVFLDGNLTTEHPSIDQVEDSLPATMGEEVATEESSLAMYSEAPFLSGAELISSSPPISEGGDRCSDDDDDDEDDDGEDYLDLSSLMGASSADGKAFYLGMRTVDDIKKEGIENMELSSNKNEQEPSIHSIDRVEQHKVLSSSGTSRKVEDEDFAVEFLRNRNSYIEESSNAFHKYNHSLSKGNIEEEAGTYNGRNSNQIEMKLRRFAVDDQSSTKSIVVPTPPVDVSSSFEPLPPIDTRGKSKEQILHEMSHRQHDAFQQNLSSPGVKYQQDLAAMHDKQMAFMRYTHATLPAVVEAHRRKESQEANSDMPELENTSSISDKDVRSISSRTTHSERNDASVPSPVAAAPNAAKLPEELPVVRSKIMESSPSVHDISRIDSVTPVRDSVQLIQSGSDTIAKSLDFSSAAAVASSTLVNAAPTTLASTNDVKETSESLMKKFLERDDEIRRKADEARARFLASQPAEVRARLLPSTPGDQLKRNVGLGFGVKHSSPLESPLKQNSVLSGGISMKNEPVSQSQDSGLMAGAMDSSTSVTQNTNVSVALNELIFSHIVDPEEARKKEVRHRHHLRQLELAKQEAQQNPSLLEARLKEAHIAKEREQNSSIVSLSATASNDGKSALDTTVVESLTRLNQSDAPADAFVPVNVDNVRHLNVPEMSFYAKKQARATSSLDSSTTSSHCSHLNEKWESQDFGERNVPLSVILDDVNSDSRGTSKEKAIYVFRNVTQAFVDNYDAGLKNLRAKGLEVVELNNSLFQLVLDPNMHIYKNVYLHRENWQYVCPDMKWKKQLSMVTTPLIGLEEVRDFDAGGIDIRVTLEKFDELLIPGDDSPEGDRLIAHLKRFGHSASSLKSVVLIQPVISRLSGSNLSFCLTYDYPAISPFISDTVIASSNSHFKKTGQMTEKAIVVQTEAISIAIEKQRKESIAEKSRSKFDEILAKTPPIVPKRAVVLLRKNLSGTPLMPEILKYTALTCPNLWTYVYNNYPCLKYTTPLEAQLLGIPHLWLRISALAGSWGSVRASPLFEESDKSVYQPICLSIPGQQQLSFVEKSVPRVERRLIGDDAGSIIEVTIDQQTRFNHPTVYPYSTRHMTAPHCVSDLPVNYWEIAALNSLWMVLNIFSGAARESGLVPVIVCLDAGGLFVEAASNCIPMLDEPLFPSFRADIPTTRFIAPCVKVRVPALSNLLSQMIHEATKAGLLHCIQWVSGYNPPHCGIGCLVEK